MRALILGATGMLGHKLYQTLSDRVEAFVTVRSDPARLQRYGFYCADQVVPGVDATDFSTVEKAIETVNPDVVVNCIGIVKQHPLAKDPVASITVNSLLPHRLAELCGRRNGRLIHISTDCVFSGARGSYRESDPTDADDLYGRSKAMGETATDHSLTIRTSIIGPELREGTGLLEWFFANSRGPLKGYTKAVFSGLTTRELSRVIGNIIVDHRSLHGLYQVSSLAIDKYSLLALVRAAYGYSTTIEPDENLKIDRSLDGTRFSEATGYVAPSWPAMIADMASDPTPYKQWRD